MRNQINEIVTRIKNEQGITFREIAERCGISEQTLHSARRRATVDNIHVDVFLKIAHGLGMSADELYYGKDHKKLDDANSADEKFVIGCMRNTNDQGRASIIAVASAQTGVEKQSPSRAVGA